MSGPKHLDVEQHVGGARLARVVQRVHPSCVGRGHTRDEMAQRTVQSQEARQRQCVRQRLSAQLRMWEGEPQAQTCRLLRWLQVAAVEVAVQAAFQAACCNSRRLQGGLSSGVAPLAHRPPALGDEDGERDVDSHGDAHGQRRPRLHGGQQVQGGHRHVQQLRRDVEENDLHRVLDG